MSDRGIRLGATDRNVARVEVRGRETRFYEDLYHNLLVCPWWQFFAMVGVLFLFLNAIFATLYLARPGSITGAREGSFEDAFFFSVQTFATIGYGAMSPATFYAHCVVTLEALMGLLSVALMTGITFSKFARPTARILFSDKIAIARFNGVPTVMFRMANWRGNFLVEATLRVNVLVDEKSHEGHVFRRPIDLPLVRDRNAIFFLSWTAMHVIDEKSPFAGPDAMDELRKKNAQIMLALNGIDETAGAQIHARRLYELDAIVPGSRFVDVITRTDDGTRVIDYAKFHDVEPLSDIEAPEGEARR
jgi:inward rectifier potassium channel